MIPIRVLFYRAEWDGHIIDDIINLWTWPWNMKAKGPYSHCEILLPELHGTFDHAVCYTSTMRGQYNGTVVRLASEVLTHPDRWDYIEIELTRDQYRDMSVSMLEACRSNRGYSIWTLSKFFLPFAKWRKSTAGDGLDICSEFVQWSLYKAGVFKKPSLWSPRRLSVKLVQLGYTIHRLAKK